MAYVIVSKYSEAPDWTMVSRGFDTKDEAIDQAEKDHQAMVEEYEPPVSSFDEENFPMGVLIWPSGDFFNPTNGGFMALTVFEEGEL